MCLCKDCRAAEHGKEEIYMLNCIIQFIGNAHRVRNSFFAQFSLLLVTEKNSMSRLLNCGGSDGLYKRGIKGPKSCLEKRASLRRRIYSYS